MKEDKSFFIVENIDSGRHSSLWWVEESFNPDLTLGDYQRPEFLSLSLSTRKLKLFLLLMLLGIFFLLARSFYLQLVKGDYYFFLAESNRLRTNYIQAQRGVVYDRQNKVLVKNISGFSLLITPADLPKNKADRKKILLGVAEIAGLNLSNIEEKLVKANQYYFQPLTIKTGINYEQAMTLKIASADLMGVSLEIDAWRKYLAGNGFSHLLGYVGKISQEEYEQKKADYLLSDNIGKAGLEKYYETDLKGKRGERRVEVDALGREKKIISQIPAVAGSDLVLSVDADLQNKIYQILAKHLSKSQVGAVIVSNPQNGEILALADYPSYDNNLFSVGISEADYQAIINDQRNPLFNRSISGEYPSGSTIKPVIASAALEEKVVNRHTSFNSLGGIWVADKWFFPDWKSGGHGITNVIKALAESVNTYFYYLGGGYGDFIGLGVERIAKYLKLFGLGEKLGIDLPSEKGGLIPTPEWKWRTKNEQWYIGDTYHLSIGQGDLLVTPLQVNSYTATIANGGTIYQPHLVKEISHPDGTQELIMPKVIKKDFISPENIGIVREGMRQAALSGSARGLLGLPVTVAAKTGTAQWNRNKKNHAWLTAFAPYENPTLAITVLVEEGGEGSVTALPIAREVIDYWFRENLDFSQPKQLDKVF